MKKYKKSAEVTARELWLSRRRRITRYESTAVVAQQEGDDDVSAFLLKRADDIRQEMET